MMRWIVGSSLKFRVLVLALAVGMMVVGSGQLSAAQVDGGSTGSPVLRWQLTSEGVAATGGPVISTVEVALCPCGVTDLRGAD